jgi:uncharacterized protein (DUF2267 family)
MSDDDRIEVIDTTVQKTYRWLHELSDELDGIGRRRAYHVLRGVLHTLRDRLLVDEAAHLGAQLPLLIRGIYYESWDPSHKPEKLTVEEFLARVRTEAMLEPDIQPEDASRAVVRLLYAHIAPGEVDQALDMLPRDIRRAIAVEHQAHA